MWDDFVRIISLFKSHKIDFYFDQLIYDFIYAI